MKPHPIHEDRWMALVSRTRTRPSGGESTTYRLRSVDCGELRLESGRLADGKLTGVHIDLAVLPVAPLPEWDR